MPWIFTYSDLSPQIVETIMERAPFCSLPASLPNFRVVFKGKSRKWGGAVATLERARKSWVYGSALLLPPEEIQLINKYYSAFDIKEVPIFLAATKDKVKAQTYFLKGNLPYGLPSDDYSKTILKHLKFFWGQSDAGKVDLEHFNIRTDVLEKPIKLNPQPADELIVETIQENKSKRGRKPIRKK